MIRVKEEYYITEPNSVVVHMDIPKGEWEKIRSSAEWERVLKGDVSTGEKEENDEDDLMRVLDEEISNCIQKLRNASYGREVRTFITEYEELMLKKSQAVIDIHLSGRRRRE